MARARRQAMRGAVVGDAADRPRRASGEGAVARTGGKAAPDWLRAKLSAPGCILGPPLPAARCPHAGVTAVGSAPSVGPRTPPRRTRPPCDRLGHERAAARGSRTAPLTIDDLRLKALRWRRRPHRGRHALVLTCGSSRVGRAQSRFRQAAVTHQRVSSSVREPGAMSPRSCVSAAGRLCAPHNSALAGGYDHSVDAATASVAKA
jgi:hypothetical protein